MWMNETYVVSASLERGLRRGERLFQRMIGAPVNSSFALQLSLFLIFDGCSREVIGSVYEWH